ncbi:MAG: hypothetical protein QNI89_02400 [Desulfobacterales bacterium]|nr:hypothetical protein [Desulfobacterales bacterium]MDJ0854358.1 hypothetical protein [Desulfobacterales bacterium]MDJ0886118.1 hypothetical protein [Desulfobacterales bacterium]MDJ0990908.1 hypothetical protein [Desulfobacterales bacterium]
MITPQPTTTRNQDRMLDNLVRSLGKSDFTDVKARLEGLSPPDPIYGSWPDVTAWRDREYIFDLETDVSVKGAHCGIKWRDFGCYARDFDARFFVVVPEASALIARIRLAILDIEAEVLTI